MPSSACACDIVLVARRMCLVVLDCYRYLAMIASATAAVVNVYVSANL
jgi:hypothetical protein